MIAWITFAVMFGATLAYTAIVAFVRPAQLTLPSLWVFFVITGGGLLAVRLGKDELAAEPRAPTPCVGGLAQRREGAKCDFSGATLPELSPAAIARLECSRIAAPVRSGSFQAPESLGRCEYVSSKVPKS